MMRSVCLLLVSLLLLAGCSGDSPKNDPTPVVATPADQEHPEPAPGLPTATPTTPTSGPGGNGETPIEHPVVPDANQDGPLPTKTVDYDFGVMLADDGGQSPAKWPIQVLGEVTYPTDGAGPFPLIVLMHGRHGTCAIAGVQAIGTHVCPNVGVVTPVDSYKGYEYLANNLASHGYIVASINANQPNDRDQFLLTGLGDFGATMRAQLLLQTLDMFAGINDSGSAGDPVPMTLADLKGHIDMDRIGIMGHSRGGEGVARTVSVNAERAQPHHILAVFALAPTDFARWQVPGVAFATILPYCDGDVSNLQGALMYDDARTDAAAPRYQILAMGANHNFYNTIWTGDDWGTGGDPYCGSGGSNTGRDTGEVQRQHGLWVMASFFRLYVGGESAFAPAWADSEPMAGACPDVCGERLLLSREPPADRRTLLSRDGKADSVEGVTAKACDPANCPGDPTYGSAAQTAFTWNGAGAARFALPGGLASTDTITLRVGVPVGEKDVQLRLRVEGDGITSSSPTLAVLAPPGDSAAKTVLSMVRFPAAELGLTAEQLAAATAVSVVFDGGGSLQVADVMVQA